MLITQEMLVEAEEQEEKQEFLLLNFLLLSPSQNASVTLF